MLHNYNILFLKELSCVQYHHKRVFFIIYKKGCIVNLHLSLDVENSHFLFHLIKMSYKENVLQNKFQRTLFWQHIWDRANKCNRNLPHTGFVCSYKRLTTCDLSI